MHRPSSYREVHGKSLTVRSDEHRPPHLRGIHCGSKGGKVAGAVEREQIPTEFVTEAFGLREIHGHVNDNHSELLTALARAQLERLVLCGAELLNGTEAFPLALRHGSTAYTSRGLELVSTFRRNQVLRAFHFFLEGIAIAFLPCPNQVGVVATPRARGAVCLNFGLGAQACTIFLAYSRGLSKGRILQDKEEKHEDLVYLSLYYGDPANGMPTNSPLDCFLDTHVCIR
jgi:hypothetical protein